MEERSSNGLLGGKGIDRWWRCKVGNAAESECPRCGEEEETPGYMVFQCKEIKRLKDGGEGGNGCGRMT